MSLKQPAPWQSVPLETLRSIRGLCVDVDDTISTHGKLTADAYHALWRAKELGLWVVPITGRPAGWCDHIARFWPVDAVVGENGAFTFAMKDGKRARMDTPKGIAEKERVRKMKYLAQKLQKKFPGIKWASDQAYRELDLAIDFCEDVKPWKKEKVIQLVQECQRLGAHAKVSSIHVNAWYGNFDKVKGFRHWLKKAQAPKEDQWIYVGDSPNDEPLFAEFRNSVGVANLSKFLKDLKHPPQWMTSSECGKGLVEVVDRIIAAKS